MPSRVALFAALLSAFLTWPASADDLGSLAKLQKQPVAPKSGASFRLKLAISRPLTSLFDTRLEQKRLAESIEKATSIRNERFAPILAKSNDEVSEEKAEKILKEVRNELSEAFDQVEAELEAIVGPEKYEVVHQTQLGLMGVRGLNDPEHAKRLGLDAVQAERIGNEIKRTDRARQSYTQNEKALEHSAEGKSSDVKISELETSLRSDALAILSDTQRLTFLDAEKRAKEYREKELEVLDETQGKLLNFEMLHTIDPTEANQ